MGRFVHLFGADIGNHTPKELLGGKGAGLSEMTRLGIPVPPGFTITTEACRLFQENGGTMPEGLEAEVEEAIAELEKLMSRKLGDGTNPLLLSVRSGARVSMPGMMDTILNLGLNDTSVEGLARTSDDRRFAFDAYRRLVDMYGDVVLGVSREHFEEILTELKSGLGDPSMPDNEVPAAQLEELVHRGKGVVQKAGKSFPDDVRQQLWGAITAVFKSWMNARAIRYRKMHNIPGEWGTAVNVQAMVFGNMGSDSGSGVAFTRNPATGEKLLYGEYLRNAQGEDVVAGIRTPQPITNRACVPGQEDESLESAMPAAFKEIDALCTQLETHFRDMQDIEFTIEKGRVFILQTRNGKRTAHAAVRVAVELVDEGLLNIEEALLRVEPDSLEQLLHATLPEPSTLAKKGILPLTHGLPASPGAAMGIIVLDADEAEKLAEAGKDVILVRRETSPEDIHGMKAAQGIVTATGGMTSHAAVVARGLGKCCVAGCSHLSVDYEGRRVTVRNEDGSTVELTPGETITLDGTHGNIYRGELEVEAAAKVAEFDKLMGWADERRRLMVRANTDTPSGAKKARSYGAQGIGLCRTEHMFFAEDRLEAVRCMVLSDSAAKRAEWLGRIEPMQRQDFLEMFEAMDGLPVTIRLLDWPLHEFLPKTAADYDSVSKALGVSVDVVKSRADGMREINPMLGHRGVRLGLTQPAIYKTQVRAIMSAAAECKRRGIEVLPEIMIPVVAMAEELSAMRKVVTATAEEMLAEEKAEVPLKVGTMIELPRACIVADKMAESAEFFSFGTNDLTQTVFGLSRDDSGKFLTEYMEAVTDPNSEKLGGFLAVDPFVQLDEGVRVMMRMAFERGRSTRPDLKVGLCGEHGADAASIAFCEELGLSYVSCSTPRLPIARLAAAQAALRKSHS